MELGNECVASSVVKGRGICSASKLGDKGTVCAPRDEDWELDKRVAELLRPNLHTMSCG